MNIRKPISLTRWYRCVKIALLFAVLAAYGCKKKTTVIPDPGPVKDSTAQTLDLNSTALPGMHKWFGSIQTSNQEAVPTSLTGDCFMQFGITVLNDTAIVANRDTMKLNRLVSTPDMLTFQHWYWYNGPGHPSGIMMLTTELEYSIKTKKITYLEHHPTPYMGDYSWELVVYDTIVMIPTSLLSLQTPHMTGIRDWYVHRTGGAAFVTDTVISFALNVVNDTTIETKSFWYDQSNAHLAGGPDDEVLYYASSDVIEKTITFCSYYYPVRGGSLTYYYAKDSMVYDYEYREGSGGFAFILHTQ